MLPAKAYVGSQSKGVMVRTSSNKQLNTQFDSPAQVDMTFHKIMVRILMRVRRGDSRKCV